MTPAATAKSDAPPENPVWVALRGEALHERMRRWAIVLLGECLPGVPSAERDEMAKDAVQESTARALAGADKFDPVKGEVGGWVYGILYRVIGEQAKESRRRPVQPPNAAALNWLLDDSADEEALVADRLALAGCLDRLTAADRQLIELRYRDELDFAAIGRQLGITAVSARVRHFRAVQAMQRHVGTTTREGGR